jgi:hypothetical protein
MTLELNRLRRASKQPMFGRRAAQKQEPLDRSAHRSLFDARLFLAQEARRRNRSRTKLGFVAAALLSALLVVAIPTADASWFKYVGLGTTSISDDLVEAEALVKDACGDNSAWGQVLCQNAKSILNVLEQRAN